MAVNAWSAGGAARRVWGEHLGDLCARAGRVARRELERTRVEGRGGLVPRPVRAGAGDVTYALDHHTEVEVERWFEERAREGPLSLLTEDTGWRHRGPSETDEGGTRELAGFDHGGPRIVLDPVDGTRNLMADLRAAWTVAACAPPGTGEPRLAEVVLGVVSEIPDSRAALRRELSAGRGEGCVLRRLALDDGRELAARVLHSDDDDRPDHGYFPFFRYAPDLRPALAAIEAAFFDRLQRLEGADTRHCFDDQYISNAGQLVLLSLGTYRMVADLRGLLGRRARHPTTTSKPYDVAGAVLCAREAGCLLQAPDGSALDFPLDCRTPVDFVGWVNAGTEKRLGPHLQAVLAS